jgi:hypothetical protein
MKHRGTRSVLAAALAIGTLAPLTMPINADAAVVLCQRKNRIKLRIDVCKSKETQLDAAELGVTGPTGPQGQEGPVGPAGPGGSWALVDGTGTILAQSGGISVPFSDGAGIFIVDFGTSLTGKAIVVSGSFTPLDLGGRGAVTASLCGPAPQGLDNGTCAAFGPTVDTDSHVILVTSDGAGSNEPHGFYVTAF